MAVDPLGESIWTKAARVIRVYTKERQLVRQINEINKNKALSQVRSALDEAGDKAIVRAETDQARDSLAKGLSDNGKFRGPEQHPGYPEHVHPQTGPYSGSHVQTADPQPNTRRRAAAASATLLSAVAPFSAQASKDPCTTNAQFVSAVLWDVAGTIDPVFLTDGTNYLFGLGDDE